MNDEEKKIAGAGFEAEEVSEAAGAGPKRDDIGHKALSDALNISFRFLKLGMLILLVLYLMQGWFYVPPDRVAIKLSFGRPVETRLGGGRGTGYVRDSESGWHFAWPWQEIVWLSLEQQSLDLDTDFARGGRAFERTGSSQTSRGRLSLHHDNYLVTGDVNLMHMALRARYRIRSDQRGAFDYAFRFRSLDENDEDEDEKPPAEAEEVLRRMIRKATIGVVSNWEALEVRRRRREIRRETDEETTYITLSLHDEIESRVRELMSRFEERNGFSVGLELVSIEPIEDPDVPSEVRPAFDRALDAESEKETMIQEANRDATSILHSARGDAEEILGAAEAYKSRLVSSAGADADMMENLLPIYTRSPRSAAILRDWHYGRMVDELLGMAEGSFVLHGSSEIEGRELWLELSPSGRD